MVKKHVSASRRPIHYRRVFLVIALPACIGSIPAYGLSSAMARFLDTTMPLSIPAEIIADWEAQDSTATIGYAQAIQNIISKLPGEYALKVEQGSSQEAYLKACHVRRVARMEPYVPNCKKCSMPAIMIWADLSSAVSRT